MSLGSENGLSVADIAAVTDRNNGNCGNGWGGGFGEMLVIIWALFITALSYGSLYPMWRSVFEPDTRPIS